MAYNDDAVLAKLSAVNESHDSISSSAQWILFHRRHANRTVELWLSRLKSSSSTKRLSLIYLANELAQQSKIRQKMDFIEAFAPVMAEGVSVAYKGAPSEVQGKIKRVVDVWRDRKVFEDAIQEAVDSRISDLDKMRGTPSGFIPFAAAPTAPVPQDLGPIVTGYQSVNKTQSSTNTSVATANQDYARITDPATPPPSAPVYAARLNGLLKVMASAESAVSASVTGRKELVEQVRKLLDEQEETLADEEGQLRELAGRRAEIEKKKDEVERSIILGITTAEANRSPADGGAGGPTSNKSPAPEPDRPEVEALTPPTLSEEPELPDHPTSAYPPVGPSQAGGGGGEGGGGVNAAHSAAPGIEMLSNLASQYQSLPVTVNGANKRRRLDTEDGFPDLGADDGIDPDVAEMLPKV